MFASHVKGKVNTFGGKLAWECLWVEDGSTFYWTAAKMKGTVMECCRSSSRKQKKYKRNISTKTSFFFRKVLTKEFPVTRGKYEKKQNWYSVKGWLECLVEIWTKQLLKPFPPDSSFAGYILRTDLDLETGNSLFIWIQHHIILCIFFTKCPRHHLLPGTLKFQPKWKNISQGKGNLWCVSF